VSLEDLRLFVVMLGGRHARANTEVHDVVFAVGADIKQTYPQLRQQWFGEAAGLHLDSWMTVDGVEDWQVRLSAEAPAADAVEAKRKALAQAAAQWIKPHRDALLEVDSCLPVGPIGGLHVQLRHGAHAGIHSQSDYIVIS